MLEQQQITREAQMTINDARNANNKIKVPA